MTIEKAGSGNANVFLRVEGEKSMHIRIKATDLARGSNTVEFGKGAQETAVVRQ